MGTSLKRADAQIFQINKSPKSCHSSVPSPPLFFAPYSSSKKQFKVENLGLCFLTRSGSSFNCENVQSENLTWQQFLNDLALAVKSTSALQEQIFTVFSGGGTKRFFLLLLFFFKRKLYTDCVLCFLPTLKVKSAVLFSLFPTHFISPKKINPFPALAADTSQQQRGRTEAQASNVTFLPLQPHTVKTRLGNVIVQLEVTNYNCYLLIQRSSDSQEP